MEPPVGTADAECPEPGLVIAIDGPAGSGKTTLAHSLARELGLPHLNTGLMYRALARQALERGIAPDDHGALREIAEALRFDLNDDGALMVDGKLADSALVDPDVEQMTSSVARHSDVREIMRHRQRQLGGCGSVTEGRDIASHVFPNADVKLFLSAAPDVRAGRRERDRRGVAGVREALHRRDEQDAKTNPLRPVPGAVVLDSTHLSAAETLNRALEAVREVTAASKGSRARVPQAVEIDTTRGP